MGFIQFFKLMGKISTKKFALPARLESPAELLDGLYRKRLMYYQKRELPRAFFVVVIDVSRLLACDRPLNCRTSLASYSTRPVCQQGALHLQ